MFCFTASARVRHPFLFVCCAQVTRVGVGKVARACVRALSCARTLSDLLATLTHSPRHQQRARNSKRKRTSVERKQERKNKRKETLSNKVLPTSMQVGVRDKAHHPAVEPLYTFTPAHRDLIAVEESNLHPRRFQAAQIKGLGALRFPSSQRSSLSVVREIR